MFSIVVVFLESRGDFTCKFSYSYCLVPKENGIGDGLVLRGRHSLVKLVQ